MRKTFDDVSINTPTNITTVHPVTFKIFIKLYAHSDCSSHRYSVSKNNLIVIIFTADTIYGAIIFKFPILVMNVDFNNSTTTNHGFVLSAAFGLF